jgi:hypothetical protein
LPGEYGCYRSHLKILSVFLYIGEPAGVIVVANIELLADLIARAPLPSKRFQARTQSNFSIIAS